MRVSLSTVEKNSNHVENKKYMKETKNNPSTIGKFSCSMRVYKIMEEDTK